MSYVVTIRRPNGPGLCVADVRAAIAEDASFGELSCTSAESEAGPYEFPWRVSAESSPVSFVFESGAISVTTPSHAALRKMQQLAVCLNARVFGEEGEDLTDVAVPEHELSPGAGLAGCGVMILVLGVLAWWAFAG